MRQQLEHKCMDSKVKSPQLSGEHQLACLILDVSVYWWWCRETLLPCMKMNCSLNWISNTGILRDSWYQWWNSSPWKWSTNIYTCHWLPLQTNHFRPTGFIHQWRSIDRTTLSLKNIMDKKTSWLVNVTFDWRQVMTMAVQRYGRTHYLITFLHCLFCSVNTESSQLIHTEIFLK